jgi:hypothetical protein
MYIAGQRIELKSPIKHWYQQATYVNGGTTMPRRCKTKITTTTRVLRPSVDAYVFTVRYCKNSPERVRVAYVYVCACVSVEILLQRKMVNLFRYDSVPMILHPSVANVRRVPRSFYRGASPRESNRGRAVVRYLLLFFFISSISYPRRAWRYRKNIVSTKGYCDLLLWIFDVSRTVEPLVITRIPPSLRLYPDIHLFLRGGILPRPRSWFTFEGGHGLQRCKYINRTRSPVQTEIFDDQAPNVRKNSEL